VQQYPQDIKTRKYKNTTGLSLQH